MKAVGNSKSLSGLLGIERLQLRTLTTISRQRKFVGDSDAHIVRGLIAILEATYSGKPAADVLRIDPEIIFEELQLREHLTPQRSNGLRSMVERLRREATEAVAA